jgi:hypothetical protein
MPPARLTRFAILAPDCSNWQASERDHDKYDRRSQGVRDVTCAKLNRFQEFIADRFGCESFIDVISARRR